MLRIPPQRGDLVLLCLDLPAPARLLQVGRDGRDRVAPHPARPLPAPAGHRPHRLRGHPAQPGSPEAAADGRTWTRSGRRTMPSSTTSSGFTSRTSPPTTGSNACAPSCRRSGTTQPVLAGFEAIDQGRRVLEDAMASARPGRPPWISSGRATSSSSGTSSAPGATQLRSPLVRVRQAHLDRLGHELRGARRAAGGGVLHLVLPLLAQPGNPARSEGPGVAEDNPLRRPLALARDQRRSALPADRCRYVPGQRQPATHLRRSARFRVGPLRPAVLGRGRSPNWPSNFLVVTRILSAWR